MSRLELPLSSKADWVKVFDPRGSVLFVATPNPPAVGTEARVDLSVSAVGPRVILLGTVLWRRTEGDTRAPRGCGVALAVSETEKINFLNGYVRGGLLDRRERRRLPLRLPVTYGAIAGPAQTVTRDINEEGMFILTRSPLPEDSLVYVVLSVPGHDLPIELKGVVSHTVLLEDRDVPGMGIRYVFDDGGQAESLAMIIDMLERDFFASRLPESVIT